ncbi:hypothetical protein [Paenibacillus sp. PCH8]|uniref:hypothetical protein n=1 Tax=Paenibacillus sp. PCH8 TaxID=2066524 RepID=UPI00269B872C|nr:hypothetical protein [Paenibacillus sp. PCH8]
MSIQWKPPEQRLSPHAVNLWRISAIIWNTAGLVILAVLLILDSIYGWKTWIGWILWGLQGFRCSMQCGIYSCNPCGYTDIGITM